MSNRLNFRLLQYQKETMTNKWQSMGLSVMNTTDATLKTQNEMGECLTQHINAVLFAMTCQIFF